MLFSRFFHPLLMLMFDEDDGTASAPAATPATPAEPAAVAPPAAPWAADLATYFEDPAALAAADRYLREKVQPHTTKLEQKIADYQPAHELFDDLREDPLGTYLAMTSELLPELSDKIAELIAAGVDPAEAVAEVTENAPAEDPDIAEMKAEHQERKRKEAWDTAMTELKAKPAAKDVEIHEAEFAVFVKMADGDFDNALEGYKQFIGRWAPPPAKPEVPAPPGVLGTQPGGSPPATPKLAKDYGGWDGFDEALADTLAEQRANRDAPPVGLT